MKFILTGGTGFIGRALRAALTEEGHEVVILTRRSTLENQPGIRTRFTVWSPPNGGVWEKELEGMDGVINLAGEPIVERRWTAPEKQKILKSRVDATRSIVRAIQNAKKKPPVLVNASAVGYYGFHGDEELTEASPAGRDFLGETCQAWEKEAIRAEAFGTRVVRLRTGIVLEKNGGALAKMLPPFRLGLGGPLGDGRQWMSWIHLDDLIGLILFALKSTEVRGALNGTAPFPVSMKEFTRTLGRVLHRPAIFPVPGFVLKVFLGEMADILLKGQRVVPKKAMELGFQFRYPRLEEALEAILRK